MIVHALELGNRTGRLLKSPNQRRDVITMNKTTNALCAELLALATWPWSGQAQTPGAAILRIDISNYVPYTYDTIDIQKLATAPVLTPPYGGKAFSFFVFIGDIVAVNGQPVKGLWTARSTTMSFEPNAVPGHSTADLTRGNVIDMYWEILQVDGTPIGILSASGLTRGVPPPGAPLAQTGENLSIIGGTGAFLGARGQAGVIDLGLPRQASVVEDPASRRTIGGAKRSYVLHPCQLRRSRCYRAARLWSTRAMVRWSRRQSRRKRARFSACMPQAWGRHFRVSIPGSPLARIQRRL